MSHCELITGFVVKVQGLEEVNFIDRVTQGNLIQWSDRWANRLTDTHRLNNTPV